MVTSINFVLNSRKSAKTLLRINVRDKLNRSLKEAIRSPTSIRFSQDKAGNELLRACLIPKVVFDSGIEGDCVNGEKVPFILYGPMVLASAGKISLSGAFAGKESKPVKYNESGGAINDEIKTELVALTAKAWFKAQCPPARVGEPPVPKCEVADAIEIAYEINPEINVVKIAPLIKGTKDSVVYSVKELSDEEPRIHPIVVPPPLPLPPDARPPPLPRRPISCIGDTIQVGPYQCACPPGQVLIRPRRGECMRIVR